MPPVFFDNHVTHVDSDPEFDPDFFGKVSVAPAHHSLDVERVAHCINGASELDQNLVAASLDDTPAIGRDPWFDQLGKEASKACSCALFVSLDQAGVADNIGRQDRC
jgi:hypothetical protein